MSPLIPEIINDAVYLINRCRVKRITVCQITNIACLACFDSIWVNVKGALLMISSTSNNTVCSSSK